MAQETESYWTAVANIVRERPHGPSGVEKRVGTKHFAPGAKVYIIDWYAGMCERIIVVGLHRKSKRMITLVIDVRLVENCRAKVCYTPAVIEKIREHFPASRAQLTKELAETVCKTIPFWQAGFQNTGCSSPAASQSTPHQAPSSILARLRLNLSFLLKN